MHTICDLNHDFIYLCSENRAKHVIDDEVHYAKIFKHVADGLLIMHNKNYVHSDIKPGISLPEYFFLI